MRTESNSGEYHPSVVVPEIAPRSPWSATSVEALPGLRLRVAFVDGLTGTVDLSRMVRSPRAGVFAALADPAFFAQVRIDYGAVTWPGELDLAPDAMHSAIQEHGEWILD
ncbi:MAG: DUF2442 domain-containing protein [Acidobacteriaceae bacterium]|nr:DUF2442 domain-containing protein [Acidobacteriaceae bacterium]